VAGLAALAGAKSSRHHHRSTEPPSLGSAWIGIGLLVGAFFNWTLVAPRL